MMKVTQWGILLALLFVSGHVHAQLKVTFPVQKFTLKNGLTVLLAEDHSVPMISYHTWYRVGSRDEAPGVTGAAHMLEHMMFKGAKKYSGKDFDRILHENGIVNNAFTNYDYTGFYENLPSSKLELIMDMEVDRMRFLNLQAQDLKSELQVVGEERRWRVDNNPMGLLREMFMGTLFKKHPYSWPIIGTMKDIQAYTVEKLQKFYDQFYVPNNAVLVLAGDFNSSRTKSLIEKYYGVLESKPLPPRNYTPEPDSKYSQRKRMQWNVQNSSLLIGYKGVAAGTADGFALDLAAAVLGSGNSSRLHKKLVYEKQIATNVSAYNMTNADPGAFMVMAGMKPGLPVTEAENLILSELSKMKNELVSEQELQKVKNQVMMDFVDSLSTIDGKAQALAINEIFFNDYQRMFTDLDKYNQVTPQDVQRVMNTYVQPVKKITAVLDPKAASGAPAQGGQ